MSVEEAVCFDFTNCCYVERIKEEKAKNHSEMTTLLYILLAHKIKRAPSNLSPSTHQPLMTAWPTHPSFWSRSVQVDRRARGAHAQHVIALKLRELVFRLGPRSSVLRHELLLRLVAVAFLLVRALRDYCSVVRGFESGSGLVSVWVH